MRIRFPRITNLCHFPHNQRTLGLCLNIEWVQREDFIECTECLGIFPEVYECQTLIELRIGESGVSIRCLTGCVPESMRFIEELDMSNFFDSFRCANAYPTGQIYILSFKSIIWILLTPPIFLITSSMTFSAFFRKSFSITDFLGLK